MSARLNSIASRRGYLTRQQMLHIGGGAVTFAFAALLALVFYGNNNVDASQTIGAKNQEQLAFGTVVLLAPTSRVPAGAKLNTVILKEVHWPRNEVPEGAIRRPEDLQEMFAKTDLAENQPILRTALSTSPLIGGVADLIPPGHRATTIEVDSTSGVEGWATPGAHVDVLVTYHDPADGQKKSQIAVEDAMVVSFNGRMRGNANGAEGGRFASTATVTLAVPVVEAVKIHTARAMGKISLILRNTSDQRTVGESTVTSGDIKNVNKKVPEGREIPKGFVRFTDEGGSKRQLELRNDQRWWTVTEPAPTN